MSEQLPQPESLLTPQQASSLEAICLRYTVKYNPSDYFVYPADSTMMAGWAEGWVGGREIQAERPTLYVGVSPEGEVHT